jgi:hypothetical protein
MTPPVVISFCDRTGNFVKPWLEAGYECWCVDWEHPRGVTKRGPLTLVGADVHELHRDHWWLPSRDRSIAFFAAFPDCTFLTNSGQRWQEERGPGPTGRGLLLVDACWRFARDCRCPYLIENPSVGKLSAGWKKPNYTFHPWEYSGYLEPSDETPLAANDAYSKGTGLWTGGGFVMPEKRPHDGLISTSIHDMAPSEDRADKRSILPMGFARAIFAANASLSGTEARR